MFLKSNPIPAIMSPIANMKKTSAHIVKSVSRPPAFLSSANFSSPNKFVYNLYKYNDSNMFFL